MEPSVWTRSVPFVRDGQPVNQQVTNAPTQVLADRTAALKSIVDSIEAGEQLLVRDAPLGEGIEEGHVVYLNPTTLRYDRALARYQDLASSAGRLTPAASAVFAGVVISKASAYAGDILCTGMGKLTDAAIVRLFNGAAPLPAIYYLSSIADGSVEALPPAMLVRVCQYIDGNVVRVFPPTFEPETHSHRDYRLYAGDWQDVSVFDPALVPSGAKFGYNLDSPQSTRQMLREALLPAMGEPEYVWAYFRNNFEIADGVYAHSHKQEFFTLSATDIANKFILLGQAPTNALTVRLLVRNSGTHEINIDYRMDSINPLKLAWDGMPLELILREGDEVFVLYEIDYGDGGSSGTPGDDALAGRHVNDMAVLLNETGIWWLSVVVPPQDIYMTITVADARQMSLIYSIWSRTPNALEVLNNNGRVAIGLKDFERQNNWTEGWVVGDVDAMNGRLKRRQVVTKLIPGLHLKVSPTEGVGDVVVDLAMFQNYNLNAAIINLNNAITRTESPYVFTEFPQNRTSSANFMLALPNLSPDTLYKLVLWGLFIGTGVELDAPVIACSALPTPATTGSVVYAVPGFPTAMGVIPAGTDVYLVECPVEIPADGLASGQLLYELSVDNPDSSIKLLGSGVRLTLKAG